MKLRKIHCINFKRFTDLTIDNIPESAKLVLLIGPNGCGKSSLFDAFNEWFSFNGYRRTYDDEYYVKYHNLPNVSKSVNIEFHGVLNEEKSIRKSFYFRTAYRNEANFFINSLNKQNDPRNDIRIQSFSQNDATVSQNYQRLVSRTVNDLYNSNNNERTVLDLRDELTGKIRTALSDIFDDLQLSNLGDPLQNGSFYFKKGDVDNFKYMNLSAGEKSAFDLILDIVIKQQYYPEAIYCIDEPEIHLHTSLQSKLLETMYNLMPGNSQLWLATHSIGMLKKAKELNEALPGSVVFIDFSNKNFDSSVTINPSVNSLDKAMWKRFMDVTFGEFSSLVAPNRIVLCEGDPLGTKNKNMDATIYNHIFNTEYPDTQFVSVGNCKALENPNNPAIRIIREVYNAVLIILVDRDDMSKEEVAEQKAKGVTVLSRRHIESYLMDDEIIQKLCENTGHADLVEVCKEIKKNAMDASLNRGNPTDDVKSATGEIIKGLKRTLSLSKCGNTNSSFLRDTITPLITSETEVYKQLKCDIFGS